ncbi:MAG: GNAT family N-acetyltransferase [Patescibacteria group bacterium]
MMYIPDRKSLSVILKKSDQYQNWVDQYLVDIADQVKIQHEDAFLYHHQDKFDSEMFGLKVGKIEDVIGENKSNILHVVNEFFETNPYEYCVIRLAQHFIDWIQAFQQHGALFLDATVELVCDVHKVSTPSISPLVTEELSQKMIDQTLEIASSFCHGRFFTDPDLQKGFEVYTTWIQNSIDKKAADRTFVLYDQDQVHGFATIKGGLLGDLKSWRIQLVGKHGNSVRSGVAETLLQHVIAVAQQDNVDVVLIATQCTNIPALRAYQSAGFSPYGSGVTLGWKKHRKSIQEDTSQV